MKAYLAIKYHPDHSNRPLIEAITAVLDRCEIETYCVTRDLEQWGAMHFTPTELMAQSFAAIDACDLVVIELSEKGIGLGIEAGYAWARHIPIVTIAHQDADISETLRGISQQVGRYETADDLFAFFKSR